MGELFFKIIMVLLTCLLVISLCGAVSGVLRDMECRESGGLPLGNSCLDLKALKMVK